MASLFGMFNKPKKYKARRDSKKKLEKLIDKDLATAIATNSEVERQWLEKKYSIYVDSENDPIAKMAAELRGRWTAEALKTLGEDEKSQEATTRALIDEIKKNYSMSQKPHKRGQTGVQANEGASQANPTEIKRKNLRREMIKQFTEKGKNNIPATDNNRDELTRLVVELAKRVSFVATGGSDIQTIAVEIDGNLVEMSPEAYEIFKKQREELLAARARSKDLRKQAPNSEPPPSK